MEINSHVLEKPQLLNTCRFAKFICHSIPCPHSNIKMCSRVHDTGPSIQLKVWRNPQVGGGGLSVNVRVSCWIPLAWQWIMLWWRGVTALLMLIAKVRTGHPQLHVRDNTQQQTVVDFQLRPKAIQSVDKFYMPTKLTCSKPIIVWLNREPSGVTD